MRPWLVIGLMILVNLGGLVACVLLGYAIAFGVVLP